MRKARKDGNSRGSARPRHRRQHRLAPARPARRTRAGGRRASVPAVSSASGSDLAERLRERDLTAAADVLNLVENRAPERRDEIAALLARRVARDARRRGAGARRRDHRPARARASPRCSPSSCARGARASGPSRCSPSTRRRGARADRCSATARGSPSTPPIAGPSCARWPPAGGSAASPRRRAPPPTRSPPRSTSSSSRPSASGSRRPRWPRRWIAWRSWCSPRPATSCSS